MPPSIEGIKKNVNQKFNRVYIGGGKKERVPAAPLEKAEDRFDGQNDVNLKRAEEAVVMVNGNGI